jgi:hypothetical protein
LVDREPEPWKSRFREISFRSRRLLFVEEMQLKREWSTHKVSAVGICPLSSIERLCEKCLYGSEVLIGGRIRIWFELVVY